MSTSPSKISQSNKAADQSRVYKWGVIGTGIISADFVNALRSVPGARFTCVYSRSQATAEKFKSKYGCEFAFSDLSSFLADNICDIVYIGSPTSCHLAAMVRCLSGGRHAVLCEKTFTNTAAEARQARELANKHSVFLMEALFSRFLPFARFLNEFINNEDGIGTVKHMSCDFGIAFPRSIASLWNKESGGGALTSIGIYIISFASMLVGRGRSPSSVVASGLIDSASGVDASASFILTYKNINQNRNNNTGNDNKDNDFDNNKGDDGDDNSAVAVCSCSMLVDTQNRLDICGTKGRIEIVGEPYWHSANKLTLFRNNYNNSTVETTPSSSSSSSSSPPPLSSSFVSSSCPSSSSGCSQVYHFAPCPVAEDATFFLPGSCNLRYEACEVQSRVSRSELESPVMSLDETVTQLTILDEIKRQIYSKKERSLS